MTRRIEPKVAKTAKRAGNERCSLSPSRPLRASVPIRGVSCEQKVAKIAKRDGDELGSLSPSRASVSILFLSLIVFACGVRAEVAPVAVRVPEAKAWIGQRVPFFVELRAPGSFSGTASFDLPQLPGTLLMKMGSPVVSSQDLEGRSWFVQTHEFALFSQRPGMLAISAFAVRFAHREGFTGPATDVQAQSPGFKIEIQRPPDSGQVGFLITTESLEVTETWDPTQCDRQTVPSMCHSATTHLARPSHCP